MILISQIKWNSCQHSHKRIPRGVNELSGLHPLQGFQRLHRLALLLVHIKAHESPAAGSSAHRAGTHPAAESRDEPGGGNGGEPPAQD